MLSFDSHEELRRFMEKENIRQFDVKFCDLVGRWHHITLMREVLDANLFKKGVGFDSSSVPRFHHVRCGDMSARPDLSACFMDTTFDEPTISSVADIIEAGSGEETGADPRTVLKRAVKYLGETGIADLFMCAPELEFYLFSGAMFLNEPDHVMYSLNSPGTGYFPESGPGGASTRIQHGRGYMATFPQDYRQNERTEMAGRISEAGYPVRYHHLEVGAAGQQEIEMGFMDALTAADGILTGKYLIRDTAVHNGLEACFLPKPIPAAPGNGLHIHFRLLKNGENMFAGDGYGGLSDIGKYFIGGVLSHGRSILAFSSPSTNSYRRLRPGHETPVRFFYSVANREAAIRIPKYSTGKHARVEFRPGDPTMNPYMAISAMLMAGIDGVRKKIDPTPLNLGPYDGVPPEVSPEEHPECFLPVDLRDAIRSLESDNDYLTAGGVMEDKLIRNFIEYKRKSEIYKISEIPHPFEYEMYWSI